MTEDQTYMIHKFSMSAEDTKLQNFPLYCPKCRQETLINVKQLKIIVIKEPDAQTQSR